MSNIELSDDELIIHDGRQSKTAAAVQRGTGRMLRQMGLAFVTELPLATGRRVDLIAVDQKGLINIIEIKSSVADFRSDSKWREYCGYCDGMFFAIPADLPQEILPEDAGLIVADAYGAEIIREAPEHRLNAARRRAVLLRFARAAALRLQDVFDPGGGQKP